jgi:hypothetical protein
VAVLVQSDYIYIYMYICIYIYTSTSAGDLELTLVPGLACSHMGSTGHDDQYEIIVQVSTDSAASWIVTVLDEAPVRVQVKATLPA